MKVTSSGNREYNDDEREIIQKFNKLRLQTVTQKSASMILENNIHDLKKILLEQRKEVGALVDRISILCDFIDLKSGK